jgi:hypothetical protein
VIRAGLVALLLVGAGCNPFAPDYPQQVWLQVCVVGWDGSISCSQRRCDLFEDGTYDCLNKPERPCTPKRCPVEV